MDKHSSVFPLTVCADVNLKSGRDAREASADLCVDQSLLLQTGPSWRRRCVCVGVSLQLCIVHCTLCGLFSCRLFFLGRNFQVGWWWWWWCFVCTLGGIHLPPFTVFALPEHTVEKYLGCSPCRSIMEVFPENGLSCTVRTVVPLACSCSSPAVACDRLCNTRASSQAAVIQTGQLGRASITTFSLHRVSLLESPYESRGDAQRSKVRQTWVIIINPPQVKSA